MKVVIVGAGPAGLVTCKSMLEASEVDFPFDPIILEQEEEIGGTFRYRSYEASLVQVERFKVAPLTSISLLQALLLSFLKTTDKFLRFSPTTFSLRSFNPRCEKFPCCNVRCTRSHRSQIAGICSIP